MRLFKRIWKRLTLKKRAWERGVRLIDGQDHEKWPLFKNRNLIRLHRLANGLPAFKWDGIPRLVDGVFECPTSLMKFGNIPKKEGDLGDALSDLIAFNKVYGL